MSNTELIVALVRLASAIMMISGYCWNCALIYPATCLFLSSELSYWICYLTPEEEIYMPWRAKDE